MTCDMDVACSLGAQGCAPSEQRGFVTFAQSKVNYVLNNQPYYIYIYLFLIYFRHSAGALLYSGRVLNLNKKLCKEKT